jgi:hypothetical protein
VGAHSRVMPAVRVHMGSHLEHQSVAMKGETLLPFTRWVGNPAVPVAHTALLQAATAKQVGTRQAELSSQHGQPRRGHQQPGSDTG